MLDTRKSSRSSTFEPAPNGWKPDQTMKPSTHGCDSGIINTMLMAADLFGSASQVHHSRT